MGPPRLETKRYGEESLRERRYERGNVIIEVPGGARSFASWIKVGELDPAPPGWSRSATRPGTAREPRPSPRAWRDHRVAPPSE
jgi:hypothetical protein